ncbi:MAG: hypothetical protein EA351_11325, partial [Gemmatimonadales bacterium]
MRSARRYFIFATFLLLAAGCTDASSPTDAPPLFPLELAESKILDGSVEGGNPHFYWLPPAASQPNASGTPNMALLPVVMVRVCKGEELCRSPVLDSNGSNTAVAEFTDESGTGSALVTTGDEHYQVDWKTSETNSGESLAGQTVRVWVLLGKVPVQEQVAVGYLDLTFASDGSQARGRAGDVLREGRSLPLRFRMETGVAFGGTCLDGSNLDCVEFAASEEGFAECTEVSGACLTAEDNWVPDGFEGPILVQVQEEPLVAGACFDGIELPQRESCYRITTLPDLGGATFNAPVYFSMCQEPGMPDNFEIHQRGSDGQVRRPVTSSAPLAGLDCDTVIFMGMSPMARFAHRVREFVFGGPLHAADGLTATLISFSEFFWAPSAEFASVSAPATADQGELVEVILQLGLDHGSSGELGGIGVEVVVDGGTIDVGGQAQTSGTFLSSTPDGEVTVQWTMPTDLGIQTLTATIPVLIEATNEVRTATVEIEVVEEGTPPGVPTGSIDGLVFSVNDGESIEGAQVSTPLTDPILTVLTNDDGFYELNEVPTGTQAVQVGITGFESVIAYVEVAEDQSIFGPFNLWAAPGALQPDQ